MQLTRSSLCSLLLGGGEENLAVLIARADLPDILDSTRDAPALAALGLGADELSDLLPAVSGGLPEADSQETAEVRRTLSDRWANLVSVWTGADDRAHP